MQYIQEDGTKRFAKDSRKEGCFHIVGGDMKALETAPEERKSELQKALLSKEQLAALDQMKKHTDFNDLATKSSLGREGGERRVRATVGKAVQEAERKREQKQAEQQVHKQKRSARIGY